MSSQESGIGPLGRNTHMARVERVLEALAPSFKVPDKLLALATWLDLVVDWNQRVDLTAARNDDELVDLCLSDAAVIAAQLPDLSSAESWVDVGTGLGAPGLALAVLAPHLSLTLVEPKTKRVAFLRTVCGALKLSNVSVRRARSDELPAQSFKVAISRATLPPAEWLAEGARLATERVWVLLAKGETPAVSDWEPCREVSYRWPLSGAERRAVAFQRIPSQRTPAQ